MIERVGSKDRPRRLGAAGADEARKTEDLAVVRFQPNVDQLDRVRVARVAATSEALDLERDLPVLGDRPFAVERADVAPDHHADDRLDIGVGDAARGDVVAVAQDGVAIAEAEDFLEPVGHENN